MPQKEDRRVRRTRQLLREALFSLIRARGYEALSVQDIIDRADVGRATFYAHFENKQDLLLAGFEDLRAALRARQRQALSRDADLEQRVLAFSRELFAHVDEFRPLFRAMAGKRSGALVQSLVHKLLLDLVRQDVKAIASREKEDAASVEPLAQFIAGGMFGLLAGWLDGKISASADDLDALFRRLAIPSIQAAVRQV